MNETQTEPLWKASLRLRREAKIIARRGLVSWSVDPAITEQLTCRIMFNGLHKNMLSTRA